MNCFLLTLYLTFLLDSALASLPAPYNVSVISVDLQHDLRWDPGPGTPPGTQYTIIQRMNGQRKEEVHTTKNTSLRLELDDFEKYFLTVQAFYNQTVSPVSKSVSFQGYEDTIIRPPTLSLAGCGNCIQINISLSKAVQDFYNPKFCVLWRKRNELVNVYKTPFRQDRSVNLTNLLNGEEYCVQVHTKITTSNSPKPTDWNCTFTSIVAPRRAGVVLGAVAAVLIFAIGVVMSLVFGLHYTGFLCKLKNLPRALIMTLTPGKILTVEQTILDPISVISETVKKNKCKKPTMPHSATGATSSGEEEEEDDEEDEDEEKNIYIGKGAGLSSGENSRQDSRDVSGNRMLAVSVRLSAEVEEVDANFDKYEAKDEEADVSFMTKGGQTEVQRHVTGEEEEGEDIKEKEDACQSTGNVNLFSVTLATLAVGEEDEEEEYTIDSLTAFLKLSDLEPLLPTDSQTESGDLTAVPFMQPTPEDVNETGYEGRLANTLSGCLKASDGETQEQEEEEEEEEEEFSGYMGRT